MRIVPTKQRAVSDGKRARTPLIAIAAIAGIPYLAGAAYLLHQWFERPELQILSGNRGGLYFQLGDELAKVLTDGFDGKVVFRNESSRGSSENLEKLEHKQGALGLAQDGLDTSAGVRALARLYNSPYQIVVPAALGISDVGDLRRTPKLKIFLGAEGSGTWVLSHLVLKHYGLDLGDFQVLGKDWSFEDAADALIHGNVEVAAFLVGFGAPALERIAVDGRFTLLSVARTPGLGTMYPYLEQITIPAGSYSSLGLFPAKDTRTIATRELLVTREDLSERLAFRIVDTLFSSSTKVVSHFPLLTQLSRIEPERNFYYPLHPGAVAFYRRDDKPSLLTWDKLVGSLGYSVTILTFALVRVRRRRVRALLERIDLLKAQLTTAQPPWKIAEMHAELRDIEDSAFQLHRTYKIKDDNYKIVREAIRLCFDRMLPREPANADRTVVETATAREATASGT